jgi:hypothetical protein
MMLLVVGPSDHVNPWLAERLDARRRAAEGARAAAALQAEGEEDGPYPSDDLLPGGEFVAKDFTTLMAEQCEPIPWDLLVPVGAREFH